MKETLKRMKADLKEMADSFRPIAKGFFNYAPGKTLAVTLLTGFNLSTIFHDLGLGYAFVVLISFVGSIYLFLKAWKQTKEGLIKEDRRRIEQLCQTIDFHLKKEQNHE